MNLESMLTPLRRMFTAPPTPAQAPADRPAVPADPPSGSLVLLDTFQPSGPQGLVHGDMVARAARQIGFTGPIFADKVGEGRQPLAPAHLRTLSQEACSPEAARAALGGFARDLQVDLLRNVTDDLHKLTGQGLHDSAVNISQGSSPLKAADCLYQLVEQGAYSPNDLMRRSSDNILNALGVDRERFLSADPRLCIPERARLQQGLIDCSLQACEEPQLARAQDEYRQAVRGLESRSNSVVVSAGNDGELLDQMALRAGFQTPQVSAGAQRNTLAVPEVTTVGGSEIRWGPQPYVSPARYTSYDPQELDLFADGQVWGMDGVQGTSFAAPRVAATLASIHDRNPGIASQTAQDRLLGLTRGLPTLNEGVLPVLDIPATSAFLRDHTF